MPLAGPIIGAVGAIGGGLLASGAAKKAAKTQAQAAADATAAQERMFERQIGLQEPFRQAGLTAQQQILQLLGIGGDKTAAGYGSLAQPFGTQQFEQDPGYAFRQSEGMKALERSAAARGGLLSGSTMKGIQRFGQDLASQEYQNAFNRYQVERAARLNPLQSLMGAGQSSANTLTGAAGQMGQNQAANLMAAGQARASGYVGSANALGSALGSIGQGFMQAPLYQAQTNYLNSLAGGGVPSSAAIGANAANAMTGVSNYLSNSPYNAANYGAGGF